MTWGDEIDQADAIANGDPDARNWAGEALKLIEETVSDAKY